MKKYFFLFWMGIMASWPKYIYCTAWILGSIQQTEGTFEYGVASIYFDGNNIKTVLNKQKTRIDFELPRSRGDDQTYYLLITEQVIPVAKRAYDGLVIVNTIDYLKVPTDKSYRLYQLQFKTETIKGIQGQEYISYWDVTEMVLPENGRIPPKTVIVLHIPDLVDSFESGGSSLTWPTLYLQTLKKQTEDFMDRLTKIYFTAVDLNTVHTCINTQIKKFGPQKFIIAYGQ